MDGWFAGADWEDRRAVLISDRLARVVDVKSGERLCVLEWELLPGTETRFARDAPFLVAIDTEGTLRVWHSETGRLLYEASGEIYRRNWYSMEGRHFLFGRSVASAPPKSWTWWSLPRDQTPAEAWQGWLESYSPWALEGGSLIDRIAKGPEQGSGVYTWWEPNPIPATGGTFRIWFNQHPKNLAGVRHVYWFGANPGPGSYFTQPMTFAGNGTWYVDIEVAPGNNNQDVRFLFIDRPFDPDVGWIPGTREDKNMQTNGDFKGPLDGDFVAMIGGRATWTPERPAPGENVTITYDGTGGPLQARPDVSIWLDFDGWERLQPWNGQKYLQAMTQAGPDLWSLTVQVPPDTQATANFVFRTTAGDAWDENPDVNGHRRDWVIHVRQP